MARAKKAVEPVVGTMNAGGHAAQRYAERLAAIQAENRTRVPCRVCRVPILSANYWTHVGLHED